METQAPIHASSSLPFNDDPVFTELMRLIYHGAGTLTDFDISSKIDMQSNFSCDPYANGHDHFSSSTNFNCVNVTPSSGSTMTIEQDAEAQFTTNQSLGLNYDSFLTGTEPSSFYSLCHESDAYGSWMPPPRASWKPTVAHHYQPPLKRSDGTTVHQVPNIVVTSPSPPPMEVGIPARNRQRQRISMGDAVTRVIEDIQLQQLPPSIRDLKAMKPVPLVRSQLSSLSRSHSTAQLPWYSRPYSCLEIARVLCMAKEYVRVGESKFGSEVDIRDSLEELFNGSWPLTESLWPSIWRLRSTNQMVLRLTEIHSHRIPRTWSALSGSNEWLTFTPVDSDLYLEVRPRWNLLYPACRPGISKAMRTLTHSLPSVLLSYDTKCSCAPISPANKLRIKDICGRHL